MGESVDIESARRAADAMSRIITQLEGEREKPVDNLIVLALKRKLSASTPSHSQSLRAAE